MNPPKINFLSFLYMSKIPWMTQEYLQREQEEYEWKRGNEFCRREIIESCFWCHPLHKICEYDVDNIWYMTITKLSALRAKIESVHCWWYDTPERARKMDLIYAIDREILRRNWGGDETIEDIISSIDIVSYIWRFTKIDKRRHYDKDILCLCPIHNEKTPSLSISPRKKLFHCFGCQAWWSVINFVMAHQSVSFVEAINILKKS